MFYFRIILSSLLAIASLSSLLALLVTKTSKKKRVILVVSVLIFASLAYYLNYKLTFPKIYITQEYPMGNYRNHIELRNQPAIFSSSHNFQGFWLGVANESKNETYINPKIYIKFIDKVTLDSEATKEHKWQETEPNEEYNYRMIDDLHPGNILRTEPLIIKLDKKKEYKVIYNINVRDKQKTGGIFTILVN